MEKTADAFRTISEVAEDLDLPQHVLRFWETRFIQIKPLKRGGGRRYYRREDIELLRAIRQLLYGEGYTIKGVQKIFKEQGARGVVAAWRLRAQAADVTAPEDSAEEASEAAAEPPPSVSAEPPPHGGFEALEQILTELGECERLLSTARAG
ncbi:MAG TPA: MerR family transcriptional regulator [Methylovirgula sp.]|nr:MerR family transcriptional regulator [Methylovirgula sp.]